MIRPSRAYLTAFLRRRERWIISAGILALFLVTYFPLDAWSSHRNAVTLQLPFERGIPFLPGFVVFYVAAYLFAFAPVFIIRDRRTLRRAAAAYVVLILASDATYALFPVETLRPEFIPSGAAERLVAALYGTLEPYNLFPSLHVGISVLAMLVLAEYRRATLAVTAPMVLGISLSTLFIKQHYLVDVIGATVLAAVSFLLFFPEARSLR